jgi:predicted outer membrane protein
MMRALILGLFLLPTTSRAQVSGETTAWSSIHLVSLVAIEAGRLAHTQANSPEVRNLGQLLVRDNIELDRRLTILAAKARLHLADGPKFGEKQLAELRSLQGAVFDRKFLNFTYGVSDALRQKMRDAAGNRGNSPVSDLAALFDPIIKQDQFLSGWCLGHCLPRSNP